ncbi:hypothetical protein GGR16_000814 [Chelatococcus caeni]|uniref:Phasin domain-containing protein n=1 Tax=Chelatococcus caeni TaxID=1348468 RepID=A0A840BWF6_9HYPH|nr:phasin family protein [Chelatococcus caeni]MBB4015808.1 hypothetical protein [Chelatococcus caeni]
MTITQQESATKGKPRGVDQFAMAGQQGRALMEATQTWFTTAAEWQREMLGFMSMRLEKDGRAMREMMTCRDVGDVSAVQSKWLEETLRDYNAEMGKLMALYTTSVNGSADRDRR